MKLHFFILLHFVCGICSNTIGKELDIKLKAIQSNYTLLNNRVKYLEREVNGVKTLLESSCTPCLPKLGVTGKDVKGCDCTNLEPRHDCLDFYDSGIHNNGLYRLSIGSDKSKTLTVYCDQTTDGGGWTVFQRRMNGTIDFFRNWADFRNGFGDVFGEHWLGNENIHLLTNTTKRSKLLINMNLSYVRGPTKQVWAKYNVFYIDGEDQKYKLRIGGFSGNTSDQMSRDSGAKFSTKDQDNDSFGYGNCATEQYYGKNAWWAKACTYATLNAAVHNRIKWNVNYQRSVTFSEMKIRRNKE